MWQWIFLRAAIQKILEIEPERAASEISNQVCGFDIHPLSVQISKATILIALKNKIKASSRPVSLSIFLANTLLTPSVTAHLDIFGDAFEIFVDKIKVSINTRLFDDTEKFEIAIRTAKLSR